MRLSLSIATTWWLSSAVVGQRGRVLLALTSLYLVWGSTYLAMRWAIEGMAPLYMAGVRYIIAGGIIYGFLLWRGYAQPTPRQWRNAGFVGTLLLVGGNGGVGLAMEAGVNSALSATVVALTPLCAALFARIWGQRTTSREWLGLLLGVLGIVLLKQGDGLAGSVFGFAMLIFAALIWSFGSMWGKHHEQPNVWMASAVQMLVGGVALLLVSLLRGEAWGMPASAQSFWALIYLIFMGAIVGFSSYVYLLATVRPALATSYAYVNPVVAVALGVWLGGETVDAAELWGLAVILIGVLLVCWPVQASSVKAEKNVPKANL